jgi:hypothetical protein
VEADGGAACAQPDARDVVAPAEGA